MTETLEKFPFMTLDNLISWLETKPPNQGYCYTKSKECLVFKFMNENGVSVSAVFPFMFYYEGEKYMFPPYFEHIALPYQGNFYDTYGNALYRARAAREGKVSDFKEALDKRARELALEVQQRVLEPA